MGGATKMVSSRRRARPGGDDGKNVDRPVAATDDQGATASGFFPSSFRPSARFRTNT